MELAFGLSSLEQQSYNPLLPDQLRDWEATFFDAKIQLYSALTPQESICLLAIYGTDLQQISEFYTALLEEKKYIFTAQSVSSFGNPIIRKNLPIEKEDASREKREEYIKLDINTDKNWSIIRSSPATNYMV